MRPEERIALERGDVDRALRQASIRRVYPEGELKLTGKQAGSLRTVPLPLRAVEALSSLPARLDTPLLFPGRAGGFLNLSNFRALDWSTRRRTRFVTLMRRGRSARESGCSSWARVMGTSLAQIDKTYGHLLLDSLDRTRVALDAFVNQRSEAVGTECQ